MKKILFVIALGGSLLFGDTLTNIATKQVVKKGKEKVVEKGKEKVRKVIVKRTGNKIVGNKIADKVVGKQKKKNPVEKLKSDLTDKVLGF